MAQEVFDKFIDESRGVGMAEVKALEAALDHAADLVPGDKAGAAVVALLMAGQEYLRLEAEIEKEADHG